MNAYWLGTMLDNACILMTASLGDVVCLTAGEYNLGGDGQIYAGAFACAIAINACRALPPAVMLCAGMAAALATGFALAAVSAALNVWRSVNVLISTYIAAAAITPFIDALVATTFRGKGNLLATAFIPDEAAAPRILMPSQFSLLSLTAPLLCIIASVYLNKSAMGKKIRLAGASNDFADYSGIRAKVLSSGAVVFAVLMHSVAGFIMVVGTHHACLQGFQSGIGWSAFTVALIARRSAVGFHKSGALMVIFAALLLSLLTTLASKFTLTHFVGFDASLLIQGMAIALIASVGEVSADRRTR